MVLSPSDPAIGIVGGGQLARMLAEAAQHQGVSLHVQTPGPEDPAVGLAASVVQADVRDAQATRALAERCTAISFENEWVDLDALAPLEADGVVFLPSLTALAPLISKRSQRELLQRLHLPGPAWIPLQDIYLPPPTTDEASASDGTPYSGDGFGDAPGDGGPRSDGPGPGEDVASAEPTSAGGQAWQLPHGWSFPVVAKASTGGYDGKGTQVLSDAAGLDALLLQVKPDDWILEQFVAFERELALVAARDRFGEVECFPLVETHQHQQVCDWVLAPAAVDHGLEAAARNIAASLLTSLGYVGVLSIEFFYGPAGLLVNELAPRTHNSGHCTIETCSLSQFDQQLHIVGGGPAMAPLLQVPGSLMVNLLGFDDRDIDYRDQRAALAVLPHAHLHWYGKQGSALGRKLGHVTLVLQQVSAEGRSREAQERLAEVRSIWPLPTAQGA